jgi:hypothetical protein
MGLIELIIVVLVVLWLLGYFGRGRLRGPSISGTPPWGGSWIHTLIVIALILLILRLLRVI